MNGKRCDVRKCGYGGVGEGVMCTGVGRCGRCVKVWDV